MNVIFKKENKMFERIAKAINGAKDAGKAIEQIELDGFEYREFCLDLEKMTMTGIYGIHLTKSRSFDFWGVKILNVDFRKGTCIQLGPMGHMARF